MDSIGSVLTMVVVAALWIAAVWFGRDSRDGSDWLARTSLRERPRRLGD